MAETETAVFKIFIKGTMDAVWRESPRRVSRRSASSIHSFTSLRRNKQFGLIQPSTSTRVDVGINLKGEKPTNRL
jgi:hypothetical protein